MTHYGFSMNEARLDGALAEIAANRAFDGRFAGTGVFFGLAIQAPSIRGVDSSVLAYRHHLHRSAHRGPADRIQVRSIIKPPRRRSTAGIPLEGRDASPASCARISIQRDPRDLTLISILKGARTWHDRHPGAPGDRTGRSAQLRNRGDRVIGVDHSAEVCADLSSPRASRSCCMRAGTCLWGARWSGGVCRGRPLLDPSLQARVNYFASVGMLACCALRYSGTARAGPVASSIATPARP